MLPPFARPVSPRHRRDRPPHPLGPIFLRGAGDRAAATRAKALLILAACVALWAIGWRLSPAPAGLGTHRQFGLLPCGFVLLTGYPCPTCGMTTSFALTTQGRWLTALWVQPAGFLFTLLTGAVGILATESLLSGRGWRVNLYRVHSVRMSIALILVLLAAWGFKVAVGLAQGTYPVRATQAAMRHTRPELTGNIYTDPRRLDVAGAIDALPALAGKARIARHGSALHEARVVVQRG
jgi:hypothetical protein